ncbi:MAG: Na+/H+ antiporter NhaA [Magnetospirillum sp.]|nr:Na+/H+ antiporter NhaA [Magnetospirillum sp.]
MPLSAIREFLRLEAAGGVVLAAAAALAIILANSPLGGIYDAVLGAEAAVRVGPLGLSQSLVHWINDGLMAVFFLLVGLEIKREMLAGELSTRKRAALPAIAALGGMAVPALVYLAFNWRNPVAVRGWAIPSATDIAFAVGVLSLAGKRVPSSLKAFLLALAILDDLGAIAIIAVFYTSHLSALSLGLAALGCGALAGLNALGVRAIAAYVLVGVFVWLCVLESGVHATLAGVVLAFAIPLRGPDSSLLRVEAALHPWVTFGILPLFALANAGVSLRGLSPASLAEPVPLGILLGLFLGKQAGVAIASLAAFRLGLGEFPAGASRRQFHATAVLTGIGFTMSLFIGTLAFQEPGYEAALRIGVLAGSLLSAATGYLLLTHATGRVTGP